MPSFDVVNTVDLQEVDNAVNNTKRDVAQRYDFRGSKTEVDFDRKEKKLTMQTADKMKMDALREMLLNNIVKRGVEIKSLKFGDIQATSGGAVKREATLVEGIEKDIAKKMVKMIKDMKLKVQAAIQGDELRVTGKKLDDLQDVMTMLKNADVDVPLNFENMKR